MVARFRHFAQTLAIASVVSGCAANTPTLPSRPASASGVTPSLGARPDFAFSCDPSKYIKPSVITITPHHVVWLPSFKASSLITYYPVAGFCGIDNSFLGKDDIVLSSFRVHTPNVFSTVDTSINVSSGWEGKPDIAVWEEAWFENWLRLPSEDAHIALVHVQS